jgi:acetyl-CoA C-acetyltransferase
MRRAAIVNPLRTPIGAFGGSLRGVPVEELGNASQQNDAAAAGCDPSRMGIGPVPAVSKLLKRTGMRFDQMDLIELNEAFACQALAVLKGWGTSLAEVDDRLNVNGSGISLGHPVGATGVRIMTTLLHEMQRRGSRYGLETMCIGGGQGIAAIFERA